MTQDATELLKHFDEPICPITIWTDCPGNKAAELLRLVAKGLLFDFLGGAPVKPHHIWTSQLWLTDAGRKACGIWVEPVAAVAETVKQKELF